ncbi:MAG: ParB/RepB/Spo0J family partition protein [Ignavibacteriales bacterium]|nr:ParB/RepB/Spo0J family partition protein [Ignavibacteriales bacterium]
MADSSKSKSVLGKGLDALIPRITPRDEPVALASLASDTGGDNITVGIDIAKIRPNPYQPRIDFDHDALEDLKRSIISKGVIQPITVRRRSIGYELIAGERRLRASQAAGLTTIPAYVIRVDSDEEMLELALIENLQREHLNPIEIATSYQRLIDECRFTQEEVAQKIGKDRSTVTNFLRLLKLPDKIKEGLRRDDVTMGHARALLSLPDERTQLKMYGRIVKQGLSVRKVEEMVKETGPQGRKKSSAPAGRHDSSLQSVETSLRQAYGTKIVIRRQSGGSGEIAIEFYNADDLDRLIELLQR